MSRVAVVVPLRPDAVDTARDLIEKGPPFALDETPLDAHSIFVTDHEAVFVFEGPDVRDVVEHVIGEASVWEAATAWRGCLAGKPRVADPAFAWRRA
ncbi:MAG TPA: hypothetical protein VFJ91_07290 [Gaiellaceae bacterium]|jgi:hypothetical protein|nr:hypothetical protein [Gaiellaceae bacterium]